MKEVEAGPISAIGGAQKAAAWAGGKDSKCRALFFSPSSSCPPAHPPRLPPAIPSPLLLWFVQGCVGVALSEEGLGNRSARSVEFARFEQLLKGVNF